jgi:hypothetical protein
MMGKDLEHVVKRLRVSMVLMGKMWKHVEASGDQTWQWEISELNGGVIGQSSINGGFSSHFDLITRDEIPIPSNSSG